MTTTQTNTPTELDRPVPMNMLVRRVEVPHDRRWPAAFIFVLVAFQGMTVNLMPVVMQAVGRSFQISSKERLGLLQTTFLAGGILGLFLSGYVTDLVRARRSGTLAVVLLTAGTLALGLAGSFWQVLIAAALVGIGNFWILAPYSAVITQCFPDVRRRMFLWATALVALSAAVGNYALGCLLDRVSNWQMILLTMTAALLTSWCLLLTLARKGLAALDAAEDSETVRREQVDYRRPWRSVASYLYAGLLNRPMLWLLGFIATTESLGAMCGVTWTAQLLHESYGADDAQAAALLSSLALGVFSGRMLLGALIGNRFSDLTVLAGCYCGAAIAYSLLLLTSNYFICVGLFFLWGALVAAHAPTLYAIASAKFGPRAATAIPLVDAIGVLGSFAGPTLLGKLADHYDLRTVLWLIPAIGVLLVAIVGVWQIRDRYFQRSAQSSS